MYKKGYQLIDDEGIHTVTTKVKGLGYLKQSDETRTTNFVHQDGRVIIDTHIDGTNFRIFDVGFCSGAHRVLNLTIDCLLDYFRQQTM